MPTGVCALVSCGLLGMFGCGQNYRPVVSAINPVGPAAQPTKYAVALSSPSATLNGLLNIVDVAGDTVLNTQEVTPLGANPSPLFYTQLANATDAYAINGTTALTTVPINNPTTLIESDVIQSTLPTSTTAGANLPSITAFTLATTPLLFVPETSQSAVAVLTTATPALQQQITVPANPAYVVGVDGTPRAYAISSGTGTTPGQVTSIEGVGSTSTGTGLSASAQFTVGVDPVYGVETADVRRVFILNKGSGTVSVINVTNNGLDTANPTIPAIGTLGQSPVWADLVASTNMLAVLNQGDGTNPGSLSLINIPLCNALAQPTNSACDPTNPADAATFGTVVATVPVGVNPVMVSVLSDGSQAYVVNAGRGSCNAPTSTDIAGSVTIVSLVSGTVTATIPGGCDPSTTVTTPASYVYGHPNSVSATTGTPTGKVYITSADSRNMTVLQTDTDVVDTHIGLQGTGVRVLVTAR